MNVITEKINISRQDMHTGIFHYTKANLKIVNYPLFEIINRI